MKIKKEQLLPSMNTTELERKKNSKLSSAIQQAVWRWHFYAGIIFAPFLIILACSGGVYLFKPQIEGTLYKDMLSVQAVGEHVWSADEIIQNKKNYYPGLSITSITLPEHSNETVKLTASHDGISKSIYVDQYTGQVKGVVNNDQTFTAIFKKIHSELYYGGTWANRLVELAACWAIILIFTGLYLWWPRGKNKIWGTILPRWSKPGSRMFWRDMHAVPAFWLSLGIIILIATGLPWSGVLGGQIDKLATVTNSNYPPYALSFLAKPESVTVTKDVAEDIPWATETLPVPQSAVGDYIVLPVQEIVDIAQKQHIDAPYTISLPKGNNGVYTLATTHQAPGRDATLHIDQYSGAILTDVRFQDYGIMAKAITLGIAFHEGRLFGLLNQLLGLILCLGLIVIVFSSYIMWRKRKPVGMLGAPKNPKQKTVTISIFIIMLVFGILMPLVGASIVTVFLLDYFILRRIPAFKHWFSS